MPSSFNGADIFGPGPHRFSQGPQGLAIVPNSVFLATWVPGSTAYGPLDLDVIVTGRLVADTEAALWAQRDAITALLTFPPAPATLIDHHAREWDNMTFYRFEEGDRTDRGRKLSLTYRAHFRKDLTSLDG